MIELKDFQKTTIDQLSLAFLELWKTSELKLPFIFKAPTGAGKTIMNLKRKKRDGEDRESRKNMI